MLSWCSGFYSRQNTNNRSKRSQGKSYSGAGDGTLFGTDAVNNGGLLAAETIRNNLTFAFNGDNLVVTNTAGKVALSGYSAASNSQVLYNTVTDSQSEGVNEPILLSTGMLHQPRW